MDLVICVEIEFIGFIYGLVCSIKDRIELEIFFWDFCLRNKVNGGVICWDEEDKRESYVFGGKVRVLF